MQYIDKIWKVATKNFSPVNTATIRETTGVIDRGNFELQFRAKKATFWVEILYLGIWEVWLGKREKSGGVGSGTL